MLHGRQQRHGVIGADNGRVGEKRITTLGGNAGGNISMGLGLSQRREPEMRLTLTEDQIKEFHKNGFLCLESITFLAEVEDLMHNVDFLFAAKAGREKGDHFDLAGPDVDGTVPDLPQILKPRSYSKAFQTTIYEFNAMGIAEQLLGKGSKLREDHAILKPARHGAPTPWHQDEAYWDPNFEYNSISFWMPLQDVNVENGCMQFIPIEENMEVLPHQSIGGDPRVHGLEAIGNFDVSKAVPCPLKAGGVTIHKSRTLHYAGPNTSNTPRRAYILSFSLPAIPKPVGFEKFPWNAKKETLREKRATAFEASKPAEPYEDRLV